MRELYLLTRQELFDKVCNHLLKQGKRSITDPITDYHRHYGMAGMKSAIGCLIPPEHYNKAFEYIRLPYLLHLRCLHPDLKALFEINLDLLLELQLAHDYLDPSYWDEYFRLVANLYKLERNF